jgi:Domain of unknown function (DUF1993)
LLKLFGTWCRDFKMPFVAEGFLLSFSLPNFHFHATTAYDILRSKGVPLGKRDYLGQLRLKSSARMAQSPRQPVFAFAALKLRRARFAPMTGVAAPRVAR